MMDIVKLIEAVRLCGSTPKVDQCKRCAYWAAGDMSKCIPRMTTDAATSLSTLQTENKQLRAELENYRSGHCSEGGCAAEKDRDLVIAENKKLRAELKQVKRERDSIEQDFRAFTKQWWEQDSGFPCRWCKFEKSGSCEWKVKHPGEICSGRAFEWRGPKKED